MSQEQVIALIGEQCQLHEQILNTLAQRSQLYQESLERISLERALIERQLAQASSECDALVECSNSDYDDNETEQLLYLLALRKKETATLTLRSLEQQQTLTEQGAALITKSIADASDDLDNAKASLNTVGQMSVQAQSVVVERLKEIAAYYQVQQTIDHFLLSGSINPAVYRDLKLKSNEHIANISELEEKTTTVFISSPGRNRYANFVHQASQTDAFSPAKQASQTPPASRVSPL